MPYIENDLRVPYDKEINFVNEVCASTLLKLCGKLEESNNFDGDINYVCTQLLRKLPLEEAKRIIFLILNHFFLYNASYSKFKDAIGLLTVMEREFKRRQWGKEQEMAIRNFSWNIQQMYDKYEDLKISQNGDLE